MESACFREIRRYKYQLIEDYRINVGIPEQVDQPGFYNLTRDGELIIKKNYAWDGPSGPTIDTITFMRGSLVHDCLYQMMRRSELDYAFRGHADDLLKTICREDGMNPIRAWYVHKAVDWFAGNSAKPGTDPLDKITCIPPKESA